MHQPGPPEVVEAAVTDVSPVRAVRLQEERHDRAVRLLLGENAIQLDDGVGLDDDLAQELLGRLILGREILEEVRRRCDDLGRRRGAPRVTRLLGMIATRSCWSLRSPMCVPVVASTLRAMYGLLVPRCGRH